MNETGLQFRQYSILTWLITLGFFFIGLMFFVLNSNYLYSIFDSTTHQTYTLIFVLSISVFIIVGINIHFSRIISILISEDSIKITNIKTNESIVFLKKDIIYYNLNISKKGWLDVLRVNVAKKNKYFWLGGVSLDKMNENDILTKTKFLEMLEKELPNKRMKTTIDSIIYFSGNKLPYIFAFISIALLLIFLVYIMFFI